MSLACGRIATGYAAANRSSSRPYPHANSGETLESIHVSNVRCSPSNPADEPHPSQASAGHGSRHGRTYRPGSGRCALPHARHLHTGISVP